MKDGTTNTLKSGVGQAGLQVQTKDGKTAAATINGAGTLNVTGGVGAAGIGGSAGVYKRVNGVSVTIGGSAGNVTINGGAVTATGGTHGAGIGGGRGGAGGIIIISGGTAAATGSLGGAGIGGGQSGAGGTIKIDNSAKVMAASWATKNPIDDADGTIEASADGKTAANILMAGYGAGVNTGTTTTVKNGTEEVAKFTPTLSYKTFAFSLPAGSYTLLKGSTQQTHGEPANNTFVVSGAGLNTFTNLKNDSNAPPVTQNYTVSYSAAGSGSISATVDGGAIASNAGVQSGKSVIFTASPNSGCSVKQWKLNGTTISGNISNTYTLSNIGANASVSVEFEVIVTPDPTYTVSGNITDDAATPNPISGAAIKLVQGTQVISQTSTNASGSFTITGIPKGVYNLVVTHTDGTIVTVKVELSASDYTFKSAIVVPTGKMSSIVEVAGTETPDIVVGGLDELYRNTSSTTRDFTPEDKAVVDNGGSIVIKLVAEKKTAGEVTEDSSKIAAVASNKSVGLYIDFSVLKTVVTSTGGIITSGEEVPILSGIIEIALPIPTALQGKAGLTVYRVHNGLAETLPKNEANKNSDGEYFTVSDDGKLITMYVKKFSTYAIAVDPDTYTLTASAGSGGTISPSGSITVNKGLSKSFTITPNSGYAIANVLIDGKSVGAVSSYAFTNVSSNHTISASFNQTGGGSDSNNNEAPSRINVFADINGEKRSLGEEVKEGDATTVIVNQNTLSEIIKKTGFGSDIAIPITGNRTVILKLFAANANDMAEKNMTLTIKTGAAAYNIKMQAVDTAAISAAFPGISATLIPLTVTITESKIQIGGANVVTPPELMIVASYGSKTVQAERFSSFIKGTVEISAEQAKRITTAVATEKGSSMRHLPTNVKYIDNKYYAIVNSLTNSAYTLIENNVRFSDVAGKWYGDAANEMTSRMIINGIGNNMFAGDRSTTRAEFAKIIVSALGLPTNASSTFSDVANNAWYSGAVAAAVKYGIVLGVGSNKFNPNANITREEAMQMIYNASKLNPFPALSKTSDLAARFSDYGKQSAWATAAVGFNLNNNLVAGSDSTFRPKDTITRAEAAAVVLRFLQRAVLVDVRSKV